MADVSNDILHANGIDHDHAADGSITNVQSNSDGSSGSLGSSIQSSEINEGLEAISAEQSYSGEEASSSGSDNEPIAVENSEDSEHDHGGSPDASHDHSGAGAADLPEMGEDYAYQEGTLGSDVLVGGEGDDFLFRGDETFDFEQALSGEEFPFPTPSDGETQVDVSFENGTLKLDGEFQNFDGAPLFSQGETEIAPNTEILNGSDPDALVAGFLAVPEDVEGNKLSGTHLHFSPAGDDRGNFADATVLRFLNNELTDPLSGSGTVSGEFELTPEEQAAFSAGNLYINAHTNVDTDGNGDGGFATGESRINLNQNVARDAVAA
jgi:hypothetical protein